MRFIVISRDELHQAVQEFCDKKLTDKTKVLCVSAFWDNEAFNAMQRLPESYAVSFIEDIE